MTLVRYRFAIVVAACLLPLLAIAALAQEGAPPAGAAPSTEPAAAVPQVGATQGYTSTVQLPIRGILGEERLLAPPAQVAADRYRPAVAYNSRHDEYLVVWHNRWPGGQRDIYARRVSADGELLSWFAVATGAKDKLQPDVVYNRSTDEYLIVWMFDAMGDGSQYEIFGRLVAWNGSYQLPEFKIATWPQRSMWSPRAAWNSLHNEYLVVWNAMDTSGGQPGVPSDISSANLAADGSMLHAGNLTTSAGPSQADIVYNVARDEYFLVFVRSFSQQATGNDIYGLRVTWMNQVINPPGLIKISDDPYDQNLPAVATNDQHRYVVAWQSQDGQGNTFIQGQDLDLDGNKLQGWIKVYGQNLSHPAVAAESGRVERYAMAWEEELPGGRGISATMFGPNILPGRFAVSYGAFWQNNAPAVAEGGLGYLFAYEGDSAGDPTVERHIYARTWVPFGTFLPAVQRP